MEVTAKRYFELLERAQAAGPNLQPTKKAIRVAILADSEVSQMAKALTGLFIEKKFDCVIYAGPYDTQFQQGLDPTSELYQFEPHFVFVYLSTQQFRRKFYLGQNYQSYWKDYENLVRTFKSKNIEVLINTLPIPLERPFGNFSIQVAETLMAQIQSLNDQIRQFAKNTPGTHVVDVATLSAHYGTGHWMNEGLWQAYKYACELKYLPSLCQQVFAIVASTQGRMVKAVVVDLDNTLWGGVIGDDGVSGIQLGEGLVGEAYVRFQHYLKELKKRGLLLCVASKNFLDVAQQVFEQHAHMVLKKDDIVLWEVHWEDKATSVKRIAEKLNIGLDTILFLDDNIAEREIVKKMLPQVIVPDLPEDPLEFVGYLESLDLFEITNFSAEDRARSEMYLVETKRAEEQAQFQSFEEYLLSLKMQAVLEPFSDKSMQRVAQLIQRSNQFNLRTMRYTEADCQSFMNDRNRYLAFSVELKDRFGELGIVSAVCCEIRSTELFISELVMSCRVLKRGVEEFIMNYLFEVASQKGLAKVTGEIRRTEKNRLVFDFFERWGFAKSKEEGAVSSWQLSVQDYKIQKTFISGGPQ